MLNTILGTKFKMSQTFVGETRVPVTMVKINPAIVTDLKNTDKHGYTAIQIGIDTKKAKHTSKPLQGHFKKTQETTETFPRTSREIRLENEAEFKLGDAINISDVLEVGDTVRVTGVSKGKGFQGGVKRHGFAGGAKTHGQSDRHRAPGSIGQGTTPGRVWKGKKMAGRMGNDTITIKNLKVLAIDQEKGIVSISGPIPGTPGSIIVIKRMNERQETQNEQN